MYVCVYIYIYVYHNNDNNNNKARGDLPSMPSGGWPHDGTKRSRQVGAKDCTPKIDTSEIIVDVQWRFPMDFR